MGLDYVPVDIRIHFADRSIRIKAVLDKLSPEGTVVFGNAVPTPIGPVGSGFRLVGRISDWREDRDGRPVGIEAPEPARVPYPAENRAASSPARLGRRARWRERQRHAAAQVHGDRHA